MSKQPPAMRSATERILALDYLRGFFMFVIIIDHLNRWPNLFIIFTGQGVLWSSAAEGFFIISGFLIGYIRGRKDIKKPLLEVSKKLVSRAAMLYAWSVGLSLLYIVTIWNINIDPSLRPDMFFSRYDWDDAIVQSLIQNYAAGWSYFLKLYWIMLLLSPLVIILLRKRLEWLVLALSVGIWLIAEPLHTDWLQWQALFFIPAVVGFHLDNIRGWFGRLTVTKRDVINWSVFITFGISVLLSIFWALGWPLVENAHPIMARDAYVEYRRWIDPLFGRDPLAAGRILISFLWVAALLMLFNRYVAFIKKWFNWLLLSFGTRSLTAYTLHGLLLVPVQALVPVSGNFYYNTLLGALMVMLIWVLLQQKLIQKVFPR